MIPQDLSNIGGFNNSYTWQQYVDATRAVATADPSVGVLDLTSFGTAGTPGGLFSSSDGLHPSDSGQTKMAGMVESYLEDE
jgi:lysophospholipase L1-like esterase